MKIAIAATLSLALLAVGVHAQESKKPTEKGDLVSYSIGVNIAKGLKNEETNIGFRFSVGELTRAIQETFAGKPALSDEEVQQTLQSFVAEQQAKAKAEWEASGAKNKEASEKFLAENAKKEGVKTTESGLQYKVIKEGTGAKPKATDVVTVNYKGTLIDDKEFDSNAGKEPVSFPLDRVIPGWTEGLQLIPVGSTYQIVVPAALAYGENAPPQIGPNQALIFEVELLKAEPAPAPEAPEAPAK